MNALLNLLKVDPTEGNLQCSWNYLEVKSHHAQWEKQACLAEGNLQSAEVMFI